MSFELAQILELNHRCTPENGDRAMGLSEEYCIAVEARSEAWTSQTCPNCCSIEEEVICWYPS